MQLSISRIKAFKACRRMYELKYIEKLEPVQKPEALKVGSNYHELLEHLNKFGTLDDIENDFSKERAMAEAYRKYIYPKFRVVEAEKWLERDLGGGDKLVGIVDGIADDGHIVEHKSYGADITEEYEYRLQWDEQILAYMFLSGQRKVWYTICRKPTIRLGKYETQEEFYHRMIDWYDTDTDSKIRLLELTRTDEDIEAFYAEVYTVLEDIKRAQALRTPCSDRVSQAYSPFYRNACHCGLWGKKCEYQSVCLNYDPNQEYIEFVKGEKENGT